MSPRSERHPTAEQIESALAALAGKQADPADSAGSLQGLQHPGLYTWWVDDKGARQLSAGIGAAVDPGLIYGGQAGATKWPSGKRGRATLGSRINTQHLNGRVRGSTFRLTLAAVLYGALRLEASGGKALEPGSEDELSRWMLAHLAVATHAFPDADVLGVLEDVVLNELDPPLNLHGRPPSRVRRRLSTLRSELSHPDRTVSASDFAHG